MPCSRIRRPLRLDREEKKLDVSVFNYNPLLRANKSAKGAVPLGASSSSSSLNDGIQPWTSWFLLFYYMFVLFVTPFSSACSTFQAAHQDTSPLRPDRPLSIFFLPPPPTHPFTFKTFTDRRINSLAQENVKFLNFFPIFCCVRTVNFREKFTKITK